MDSCRRRQRNVNKPRMTAKIKKIIIVTTNPQLISVSMENRMDLLKLKQEQLRMVERKGYIISEGERNLFATTPQEFLAAYEPWAAQQGKTLYNALTWAYEPTDPTKHRLLVYYSDQTNKAAIVGLAQRLAEGFQDFILITPEPLKAQAQDEWNRISLRRQRHFVDSELKHDATDHVYVPPHRILSPDEAKTLLTRNKLRPAQMAPLQYEDPQSKYRRAQPGQIVEIQRREMIPEALVKTYPFWRVVDDPAP